MCHDSFHGQNLVIQRPLVVQLVCLHYSSHKYLLPIWLNLLYEPPSDQANTFDRWDQQPCFVILVSFCLLIAEEQTITLDLENEEKHLQPLIWDFITFILKEFKWNTMSAYHVDIFIAGNLVWEWSWFGCEELEGAGQTAHKYKIYNVLVPEVHSLPSPPLQVLSACD